ncbi:ParM/StbA family protein [Thermoactinomyces sp. CICC 10522]|uniref:ParM/StbA family protein n=1 Tax=Thermoactinomyces sp. CICC 10522 TaxID=2767427 RepID=UPI0018DD2E68|nr:ParM/StbA family protein [Thermoactinomyces sp. CICC 10522]MBH8605611.1 ParM/StbA family protein [Thermoactinomyces sp. CICC 10522]
MMKKVIFSASDLGNYDGKFIFGFDGRDTLKIPNAIKPVKSDVDLRVIAHDLELIDCLRFEIESEALQEYGKKGRFLVGQAAINAGSAEQAKKRNKKYKSDHTVINLLASHAYKAARDFEPGDDKVLHVDVVTSLALPIEEITTPGVPQEYAMRLKTGPHIVRFLNTPEFDGLEVHLTFSKIYLMPEGYAGFVSTSSDRTGRMIDDFKKYKILLLDWGGGDLDATLFDKGNVVNGRGYKYGVNPMLLTVRDEIYRKHSYSFKSNQDVIEVATRSDVNERYMIEVPGEGEVSIQTILEDKQLDLAKQVHGVIENYYENGHSDIHATIFIGGSSYFMKDSIKQVNGGALVYKDDINLKLKTEGTYRVFVPETLESAQWSIARSLHKTLLRKSREDGLYQDAAVHQG